MLYGVSSKTTFAILGRSYMYMTNTILMSSWVTNIWGTLSVNLWQGSLTLNVCGQNGCPWHDVLRTSQFLLLRCIVVWQTEYFRAFRDFLVKLLAHWKQLLSAHVIHKRFLQRLLIFHYCDIMLISNYVNLQSAKLNYIEETILWPFKTFAWRHKYATL